jgi:2-amino-4-hydroxy-6-hydroxymethyldihydropteridine diphosphokinase
LLFAVYLLAAMAPNDTHTDAYISLGSNLGDRAGNLLLGIRGMLDANLEVIRLSQIHETKAVETFAQPAFLNMVAELRGSTLPHPEELLARLLRIEYSLGRTREVVMAPRTIDLDLLLFGDAELDQPGLTVPHPRLHERAFALEPLLELEPELVVPGRGRVADLLAALHFGP